MSGGCRSGGYNRRGRHNQFPYVVYRTASLVNMYYSGASMTGPRAIGAMDHRWVKRKRNSNSARKGRSTMRATSPHTTATTTRPSITMSSISSKPPRGPPTPSPTPGPHHGPKLPKFLQKSSNRDRSKSVNEPIMHGGSTSASADSSLASSSSFSSVKNSSSQEPSASGSGSRTRRVSRLKGTLKELKDDRIGQIRERDREQPDDEPEDIVDDMPVIIEPTGSSPALGSRPRTRAERPLSASSSDSHPGVNYYHSGHSSQKLSDMGTRLSGWCAHT